MDLNKIGRFIFKLRNDKGLSQRELAALFPVTRQAVSSWETGKSLPDSQSLLKLAEIFNVTTDDLLTGKRLTEENKVETAEINLSLVDEYHSKKKTIKRITTTFIVIILTIVLIFLGYYFVNSYNTINVFKIRGENDHFKTYNGIMISTKQKNYIRIGELIKNNETTEIKSLKLYYLDANKKEKILYEDNKTDILIISRYGYDKTFVSNEINYFIDNLYLEIIYDNNQKDKIKLKVEKDFANSFNFNKNFDSITNDINSPEDSGPIIYEKVKTKMEQIGTKEGDTYKLTIDNPEEKIEITTEENKLILKVTKDNIKTIWNCTFEYSTLIVYTKLTEDIETDSTIVTINKNATLTPAQKDIYDKLTNYITTYILNR